MKDAITLCTLSTNNKLPNGANIVYVVVDAAPNSATDAETITIHANATPTKETKVMMKANRVHFSID
jgi:hypothetical protein